MPHYFVHILSNRSKTLYVGVTNDLERRVHEHKSGQIEGFAKCYRLTRLVYHETTGNIPAAITREKQIKGWLRRKKLSLVASINPDWDDLSETWYKDPPR